MSWFSGKTVGAKDSLNYEIPQKPRPTIMCVDLSNTSECSDNVRTRYGFTQVLPNTRTFL